MLPCIKIEEVRDMKICEEPCGRDHRASEIEYLFSVSFLLVGNPSDLFGIARKILDKPE